MPITDEDLKHRIDKDDWWEKVRRERAVRRKSRRKPPHIRAEWLQRVLAAYPDLRCPLCRVKVVPRCESKPRNPAEATVDHIIPVCEGGRNLQSNYQVLCGRCNATVKGNRILPDSAYDPLLLPAARGVGVSHSNSD